MMTTREIEAVIRAAPVTRRADTLYNVFTPG